MRKEWGMYRTDEVEKPGEVGGRSYSHMGLWGEEFIGNTQNH